MLQGEKNPMRRITVLFGLLLIAVSTLPAQIPVGQLFGVVRDSSGAVAPNATVTVAEEATGQSFTASTNSTGDFLVRSLAPGVYSATAELAGFKKAVHRGIAVAALPNVR